MKLKEVQAGAIISEIHPAGPVTIVAAHSVGTEAVSEPLHTRSPYTKPCCRVSR